MSDIAVGFGPDLAETPRRTCPRAVAQNNRGTPGQHKAITTGEGNRLRNPFHTQPAVAARKHGEVRQICWGSLFSRRRDFFFGLIFLFHAPRGCGFEPVHTKSGYVHRSEDVCYRVQLSLHLLLKAILFCENCTKPHSFACRTSAASDRRGLNIDGHSPSFQRHNSYISFPRAARPSSIKRCNTARVGPLFGRIDKRLGPPSSYRPPPKNSTLLY